MSAAYPLPENDPDTQQMLRAARGEAGALDSLVTGHYEWVRAFCARMLASHDASCDVAQETFLRVVANAHTFAGRSSFKTWLLAIARNACFDYLRRPDNTREMREFIDRDLPERGEPERALDARLTVERLLADLPFDQREAVILSCIHGLSFAQVARIAGCSEGAARVRAHRALKALRTTLNAPSHDKPL